MDKFNVTQIQGFYIALSCWVVIRTIMIIFSNKNNKDFSRGVTIHLFAIYVCFLVSKTLFPMLLQFGGQIVYKGPTISFNPIESYQRVAQGGGFTFFIEQSIGILVILTPMIFFLLVLFSDNFDKISKVLIASLIVAVTIEILQLTLAVIIPGAGGSVNINDIVLSTLSGFWGWILYKLYVVFSKVWSWVKKSVVL